MSKPKIVFSSYQLFIIAILAILQFTVVLDFMVLSPMSDTLIKELKISSQQFSLVASSYAFSAGISGLLAAGFADKFDRKKLLLFFYTGFIIGTLFCGIAPNYQYLLAARIFTGVFGGVMSSISYAIITDLFVMEVRGRVMGFVQMAFAASQVVGIPVGLVLANKFGWHSPFIMIVVLSLFIIAIITLKLKPVNEHLKLKSDKNAFNHLIKTISTINYLKAFMATTLLATGGFMLNQFGGAFSINNLKLTQEELPILFGITGIFSIISGPIIGRISDKVGKYKVFFIGSILSMIMVAIYTNLGATPLWLLLLVNIFLFISVSSRMISSSALMSGVPEPKDRGAFMGINSSVQYLAGGISAYAAGLIVYQDKTGVFHNYEKLGYVVVASMVICVIMMYLIHKIIIDKLKIKNQEADITIKPKKESAALIP